MWKEYIAGFKAYLLLEKGLSPNSIEAYERDIGKLQFWAQYEGRNFSPKTIQYSDLVDFLVYLNSLGLSNKSQARIISGIRSFYQYMLLENIVNDDPTELLESPRLKRKMPDVLSHSEIEQIIGAIDLSHPQGHRNRAILETLYACGLRVSELVNLRISQYFPESGLIRVIGKNNKERIVPIGENAIEFINFYLKYDRKKIKNIAKGHTDFIFLNRRGRQLTRVMIFMIIKDLLQKAGIQKKVSPHTFRHSFATHLVEGGADLKAVQDMLGHESIITTEIYTHLDTNYLRDTILNYHPRYKK